MQKERRILQKNPPFFIGNRLYNPSQTDPFIFVKR